MMNLTGNHLKLSGQNSSYTAAFAIHLVLLYFVQKYNSTKVLMMTYTVIVHVIVHVSRDHVANMTEKEFIKPDECRNKHRSY